MNFSESISPLESYTLASNSEASSPEQSGSLPKGQYVTSLSSSPLKDVNVPSGSPPVQVTKNLVDSPQSSPSSPRVKLSPKTRTRFPNGTYYICLETLRHTSSH